MSLNLGTLLVQLEADTAEFKKNMADAEKTVKDFTDQLKPIAKASTVVFGAMTGAIALFAKAADEADQSMRRLTTAMGDASAAKELADQASYLQSVSIFSDDSIMEAQTMMRTMGMTKTEIQALTPGVADLASLLGTDLAGATSTVNRAIVNGSSALTRSGMAMSEVQKAAFDAADAQGRVAMMVDLLRLKAGGMAQTLTGTVSGSLSQLRNSADDLAEVLGEAFLGPAVKAIQTLNGALTDAKEWFSSLTPEAKEFAAKLAIIVTAASGVIAAISGIAILLPSLIAGFAALGTAMGTAVLPAIPWIVLIGAALAGVILHVGLLKKAWDADFGYIKSATKTLTTFIPMAFTAMFKGLSAGLDWFVELNYKVIDTLKAAWAGFVNVHKDMLAAVSGFFGKEIKLEQTTMEPTKRGSIGAEAVDVGQVVADAAVGAVDVIKDTFAVGLETVTGPLKEMVSGLFPKMNSAGDAARNLGDVGNEAAGKLDRTGKNAEAAAEALKKLQKAAGEAGIPKFGEFKLSDPSAKMSAKEWQLGQPSETLKLPEAPKDLFSADELKLKMDPAFESGTLALGTAVKQSATTLGAEMVKFSTTFADSLVQNLGVAGEVVRSAIQGFQSGGPWGAIAAVAATLLSKTKAFSQLVEMLNEFIYWIVEMMNPLLEGLMPVFRAAIQIMQVFVLAFGMWIRVLGGVLIQLAPVFDAFASVVENVIRAITWTWNWILENLADFVSKIPRIGDDLAKSIRSAQVSFTEFVGMYDSEVSQGAEDASTSFGNLSTSIDRTTSAFSAASDALTNVPQGFKTALARFNSVDATPSGGGSAMRAMEQGQMSTSSMSINQITVVTDSPADFVKQLSDMSMFSNYRSNGSIIGAAPAYVGG